MTTMRDAATIFWKDWREFFYMAPGLLSGPIPLLLGMACIGVFLGVTRGAAFPSSPYTAYVVAFMAAMAVGSVTGEAIAGERERHTLETLMASRISARAVVVGKMMAATAHGWMVAWIISLAGIATSVTIHGTAALSEGVLGVVLGLWFGLLAAALFAGLGVVGSLRASSTRQAQQMFFLLLMALFFLPFVAAQALPPGMASLFADVIESRDTTSLVLVASGVLLAIDGIAIMVALGNFRRTTLVY